MILPFAIRRLPSETGPCGKPREIGIYILQVVAQQTEELAEQQVVAEHDVGGGEFRSADVILAGQFLFENSKHPLRALDGFGRDLRDALVFGRMKECCAILPIGTIMVASAK